MAAISYEVALQALNAASVRAGEDINSVLVQQRNSSRAYINAAKGIGAQPGAPLAQGSNVKNIATLPKPLRPIPASSPLALSRAIAAIEIDLPTPIQNNQQITVPQGGGDSGSNQAMIALMVILVVIGIAQMFPKPHR